MKSVAIGFAVTFICIESVVCISLHQVQNYYSRFSKVYYINFEHFRRRHTGCFTPKQTKGPVVGVETSIVS